MRSRFFLIANPGAGIAGAPLVEEVMRALASRGATVERTTAANLTAATHAARQAANSGNYDAIVAAGGDGTIRHVASALIGTDTPLGIIPVGTGNVLAHEIGLAATPAAVASMLLDGPVSTVACAEANGETFLLMVGAGFDARVLSALDQRLKSRVGKMAYAGPLLGALIRPADTLNVTVDGQHHTASWAVIANARHYGGHFVLAPRAGILERGLEAILFKSKSRAVLVGQLMSLAAGRLEPRAALGGDVEMLRCSRVSITAHEPVPTQIDGDVLGTTPLEVSAGTAEMRLIVPGPAGGASNSPR
jgi:YegS/Rv2252/BmrU family lipid kinase